jgi:uncharacterized protein (TIGR02302 family)
MIHPPAPGRPLRARLRLARGALMWERIWPAVWPAVAVLGVFAVLALFDWLTALPGVAHVGVLALLGLAFVAAVAWGVRSVARDAVPDEVAARRRIEQSSGLAHRPLQALADYPSGPLDGEMAALWLAHQRRMREAVRRLRVGWPAAGWSRRDAWGVRSVLAILLLLAVIDAGADWRDRLARAFVPRLDSGVPTAVASFDLWLTPPEYTGLAPQFLRAGHAETVQVPTGSVLLGQVHGGSAVPSLAIDGKAQDFQAIDKQNFRTEATLTDGKQLTLRQGAKELGRWAIEIIPDKAPGIVFAQPPQPTPRAALRLDYRANDDYGVDTVKAVIRRREGGGDETIELELPLPRLHLKEAEATSYHDLTPHPWAGLPVEIRLVASDAPGQAGQSEPAQLTLPERIFRHPVARAIIDQRRELARDPASAEAVAEILGDLNHRPQLYRDDTVVYLGLRTAQQRLRRDNGKDAITAVQQLLWDTALRIEEGNMSVAERDLRRLQQQLQDALAKGAPDAEIERLTQELKEALDRYLRALAQEMQQNPNQAMEPVDPSKVMTGRDLQRMLDRARELARSGARDQARELLAQLQNMLENLRAAQPGQMEQRGASEAQQMMRGMQEMMQRQQQLLDKSFRAKRQQGQQQDRAGQQQGDQQGEEGEGEGQMGEAAGQQESLRRRLGEMMRRMGEGMGDIPDSFGRAERAMRDAAGALQQRQPGNAIGPQTEALDQLQQAAREFSQQMQKRMGNGLGEPNGEQVGATDRTPRDRIERDPLGRPMSSEGTYDQGDVKIPDENILQKSRQILDELRRRAGERSRPIIELDYIERLLKRF